MQKGSWLWLVLACVAACANPALPDLETTGNPAQDLAQSRERFDDAIGDSYRVTYENQCFCPIETLEPVKITVRGGIVREVVRQSDGSAVPVSRWLAYRTVPDVFDEIGDGLNNSARQVTVTYDPRYGYPLDALIDYNMAADAYIGFKLRDLEPLR